MASAKNSHYYINLENYMHIPLVVISYCHNIHMVSVSTDKYVHVSIVKITTCLYNQVLACIPSCQSRGLSIYNHAIYTSL